jgi:pimeloyl-ACP methyl ester carboxylesterase
MHTLSFILGGIAAATFAAAALAQQPPLVSEDMMVASEPGIEIFVRNKRPADMTAFRPERTVLFVHGSTFPSHTGFDLKLGGFSWMDYIAARGYDVYLLDLRGFGKSTRPKEMAEKPDANPPLVRGDVAVKDIDAVVDFIRKRRGISRVNVIGHSWGTSLMATYAAQHPDKVERVVLYAAVWLRQTPSLIRTGAGPLGAYREVTVEQTRTRRFTGIPENKKADIFPPGWFEAWAEATWATDPVGAKKNPPVLRAPNGSVQDSLDFWSAGKAYYDPAKITAPVLLVHGEWDSDTPRYMSQALFPLLTSSPGKRYVELPEGTHVIYMEKNRLMLFEAVQAFLDEAGRS